MSDDRSDDVVVNSFNEESAREFRKQIMSRNMQNPNMPIVVYIDSYGGYLDSLNSMLETIEQVSNPIITVCIGKAMSCGAVLLAAGDHRFCGRFSRVMIHQSTGGDYGPVEGLQKNVDECKRVNDMFMSFLAKRCNKTLSELKQIIKDNESRDFYLDAEACLEFGIVDAVGTPSIKPIIMYQIDINPEKKYSAFKQTKNKPKQIQSKSKRRKNVKSK
jgi:ATP-dependent Clp protease protease subunit